MDIKIKECHFLGSNGRSNEVCGTILLLDNTKETKTTPKSDGKNHVPPIKVGKKPAFVKSYLNMMKTVIHTTPIGVAMANASDRSVNTAVKKSNDNRYIWNWWKLYLTSCATCHYFFAKEFLIDTQDGDTTLIGS